MTKTTQPSEVEEKATPEEVDFKDGDIVLTCRLHNVLNRWIRNWSPPFVHAGVFVSPERFRDWVTNNKLVELANEVPPESRGVVIEVRHGGPTFVTLEDYIQKPLEGTSDDEGIGIVRVSDEAGSDAAAWACEQLVARDIAEIKEASQYAYGDLAIAGYLALRIKLRSRNADAESFNTADFTDLEAETTTLLGRLMHRAQNVVVATLGPVPPHPYPGRWTCCSFAYDAYDETGPGKLVLGFPAGTRFRGDVPGHVFIINPPLQSTDPEDLTIAQAAALLEGAQSKAISQPGFSEQERSRDLKRLKKYETTLMTCSAFGRVILQLGTRGLYPSSWGLRPVPFSQSMTSSDIWNTPSDVKRFAVGFDPPVTTDVVSPPTEETPNDD